LASVSEVLKTARELERRGDWAAAAVEYKKLQETETPPPIGFNLLGDLYHKNGDPAEALTWYEKAIERYAEEGLYGNAIGICRKALRQDRDRLEVLERLGGLFDSQGLAREAVNHFILFASSVVRLGGVEKVLETAHRIRKILPDDPAVREKMGQLLQSVSLVDDALVEYRAALRHYRENGLDGEVERLTAAADKSGFLERLNDESAEESSGTRVESTDIDVGNGIEATIEPVPDHGMIETLRPCDVDSRDAVNGSDDDADFVPVSEILREFQDGVERILDENDYQSHYDMGVSYKEMGLYEEALKELDFCDISPDHRSASLEMKASILVELGRYEEGVDILRDLISGKDGNRAGCHYLMGMALEKQGHVDEALREYRQVASLDPGFRNVRERIAQVEK